MTESSTDLNCSDGLMPDSYVTQCAGPDEPGHYISIDETTDSGLVGEYVALRPRRAPRGHYTDAPH